MFPTRRKWSMISFILSSDFSVIWLNYMKKVHFHTHKQLGKEVYFSSFSDNCACCSWLIHQDSRMLISWTLAGMWIQNHRHHRLTRKPTACPALGMDPLSEILCCRPSVDPIRCTNMTTINISPVSTKTHHRTLRVKLTCGIAER